MTVERSFVVGLDDIHAVTFECKHCKARLSMKPEAIAKAELSTCPSCRRDWIYASQTKGEFLTSPLLTFLRSIGPAIVNQEDASVGFRVLFEFDEAKSGATLASAS